MITITIEDAAYHEKYTKEFNNHSREHMKQWVEEILDIATGKPRSSLPKDIPPAMGSGISSK